MKSLLNKTIQAAKDISNAVSTIPGIPGLPEIP